jgi:hypothetical protein
VHSASQLHVEVVARANLSVVRVFETTSWVT